MRRGYQLFSLTLLTFISLTVSGCNDNAKRVASSAVLHNLALAAITYHSNKGEWPDNLDQMKPLFVSGSDLATLLKNPLTGDNPGYEYAKPTSGSWSAEASSIIFYQLRDGKRDTSLPVAYGDGSVRQPDAP